MNLAIVMIISMLFTGVTVHYLVHNKVLKLFLIPVSSILYGIILFFIAVAFGMLVFIVAALPVILVAVLFINYKRKDKKYK